MTITINEKELKLSGIYKISNILDDRVYIGSAKHFRKRVVNHSYLLKKNKHHSTKLQNFVNKHGMETLRVELLKLCSPEMLLVTEQKWIDYYKSYTKKGFNECPIAYSRLGIKLSEETKAKISASNIGKMVSEETKTKLSKANKGNTRNKGKKASLETRAKISELRTGKKFSQITKDKISAANRSRVLSEETKKKISASLKMTNAAKNKAALS